MIAQGLEGTAMQSFALAARGGPLGARLPRRPPRLSATSARGERIWRDRPGGPRRWSPTSRRWSRSLRPSSRRKIGADKAAAVIAYLRANPEAR